MLKGIGSVVLLLAAPCLYAADAELERKVDLLIKQVEALQAELREIKAQQQPDVTASADAAQRPSDPAAPGPRAYGDEPALVASTPVNLDVDELPSIEGRTTSHVLANPWWRNIDVFGFGAVGFYDTGPDATRDHGSFEVKEASLFIEADVWENIGFFIELQTNRLGHNDDLFARTGEVYAHFRDIRIVDAIPLGVKVGRIDIPFGQEYLWQDAIDNPLITNSAPYVYGFDEGLLIYSRLYGVNWIASVTDGSDSRSMDENSSKAVNVKLYGNPLESLYASFSFMHNGDTHKSAVEFGGSHFQPVGASGHSVAGASPNREIRAKLMQFDAKYDFLLASLPAYVSVSFGAAEQDDPDSDFDRSWLWFSVEPFVSLGVYPKGTSKLVTFDKPELVKVYCNIRPNMVSNVPVLTNSLFAKTAGDGTYQIRGVPAGTMQRRVWREFGSGSTRSMAVNSGSAELTEDFEIIRTGVVEPHKNKFGKYLQNAH